MTLQEHNGKAARMRRTRAGVLGLVVLGLVVPAPAVAAAPPRFERHIGGGERVVMRVGAFLALGLGVAEIWLARHAQAEVDRVNTELQPYRRFVCPPNTQPSVGRCDVNGNPAPPLSPNAQRDAQHLLDEGQRWKTWSDRGPQLYAAAAQAVLASGIMFVGGFLLSDTRSPVAATGPRAMVIPIIEERGTLAGLSLRIVF
jgi:hypothetical protein